MSLQCIPNVVFKRLINYKICAPKGLSERGLKSILMDLQLWYVHVGARSSVLMRTQAEYQHAEEPCRRLT